MFSTKKISLKRGEKQGFYYKVELPCPWTLQEINRNKQGMREGRKSISTIIIMDDHEHGQEKEVLNRSMDTDYFETNNYEKSNLKMTIIIFTRKRGKVRKK